MNSDRWIQSPLHYLVVKNNDILKYVGKWMELENKNILSEGTQTQKDKYNIYSLITNF